MRSRPGGRLVEAWRSLRARHAVAGAAAVAAAIRVWCLAGVPLTITNDGVWYLMWARRLLEGQTVDWPPARTPGYPLFLCGVFTAGGVGPWPVLIAQHAIGVASAALVAWMASRLAGPRWGLVLGVLCALDPAPLALESYALSETLAAGLLLACAAIALRGRRGVWWGAALGAAIGALCLTRPAFQIVAPFLVAAWVCRRAGSGRAGWLAGAAAAGAGFLAATGPWLAHNWRAGVPALSSGNSIILWVGVCEAGLLRDGHPLPEEIRTEYERTVRGARDMDEAALGFVARIGAWRSPGVRRMLSDWAMDSIAAAPGAYAAAAARAVTWQLGVFPPGHARDELRWMLWRLSKDGRELGQPLANYNVSGRPEELGKFAMQPGRGAMARFFRWWSQRWWLGLSRVVLFGAALAAIAVSVRRRDWAMGLVLAGTLAYVGAHALFLLSPSRYSLPCWMVWWVAAAALAGAQRRRAAESVTAPSPSSAAP